VALILPAAFPNGTATSGSGEAGDTPLPLDGRSNLPGGLASLTYTPAAKQFEELGSADTDFGATGGAKWTVSRWGPHGLSFFGVQKVQWSEPIETKAEIVAWLRKENAKYSGYAGRWVTYHRSKFNGHRAYIWQFQIAGGGWRYAAWILHKSEALDFICAAAPGDPQLGAFQGQCNEAMKSTKIDPDGWA
jgi:hypothetical protein